ncbi:hypothetical protein BX070DRAFT_49151 [Coemansia spiralis]|nr:hypothetical protein BX070DRAFT_49151 [Coemansia spiralis]
MYPASAAYPSVFCFFTSFVFPRLSGFCSMKQIGFCFTKRLIGSEQKLFCVFFFRFLSFRFILAYLPFYRASRKEDSRFKVKSDLNHNHTAI